MTGPHRRVDPAIGFHRGVGATGHWDRWGQGLSLLCVAHCLVLPLVLGALPAVMSQTLEQTPIHLGMVMLAAVVGGVSFVPGFRRHRDGRVLALGTLGLSLLALAQFLEHESAAETAVTALGATVLIIAHGLNRRRGQDGCAEAVVNAR
jgi:predicted lysophospholipase L1 biosynthesis ABC-type transport system permease subunit